MAHFHKPKMFKSQFGCCICRAKSSSSRFTDSGRYCEAFAKCFDLKETRAGDICNACVLLIKRWRKLPNRFERNWAHVVDARAGPGNKSVVRRKKEVVKSPPILKNEHKRRVESEDDFPRRKHMWRRKRKQAHPTPYDDSSDSECERNRFRVPGFVDTSLWRRERVCCGVIFRGPFGEIMVDRSHYSPCQAGGQSMSPTVQPLIKRPLVGGALSRIEEVIEAELRQMQQQEAGSSHLEAGSSSSNLLSVVPSQNPTKSPVANDTDDNDPEEDDISFTSDDTDEGFFDKMTTSPPASDTSSGGAAPLPIGRLYAHRSIVKSASTSAPALISASDEPTMAEGCAEGGRGGNATCSVIVSC